MARVMVQVGRIQTLGDESGALLVGTDGTAMHQAVVDVITPVAAGIISSDPTLKEATVLLVEEAVADLPVVSAENAPTVTDMAWSEMTQDYYPSTYPSTYTGGVQIPTPASATVPRVVGGKIDVAVVPDAIARQVEVDDLDTRVTALETGAPPGDGRPSWAPAGTFDATEGLFNFRPDQLLRWSAALERARLGSGVASVQVAGDSISRVIGTEQPGEDPETGAWPWQLLHRLGLPIAGRGIRFSGGGLIHTNPGTPTNKLEMTPGGFFSVCMVTITDNGAKTAYVAPPMSTDVPVFDTVILYGGDITGTSVVTVDGVDYTWAGSTSVSGADIPCLPGFATGQRVGVLTVPLAAHTVRVQGTAAGVPIGGVELRNTVDGGVIVDSTGFSGKTLRGFVQSVAGNLDGLAWATVPRPHLLLDGLGINDWQGHGSLTQFKADRLALWAAFRAVGADVLCVISPQPDYSVYPLDRIETPTYPEYIAATYEAAIEANVPVLDIAYRWKDFARSTELYGPVDKLHPNMTGLAMLTAALTKTIS